MIAGRYNETVKIFHPVTTINKYGEKESTYQEIYKTRARVDNTSGNRVEENHEIVFSYNFNFTLRSYVPVSETSQIEWQGNKYRVLTLQRRREFNDIYVQAEKINT